MYLLPSSFLPSRRICQLFLNWRYTLEYTWAANVCFYQIFCASACAFILACVLGVIFLDARKGRLHRSPLVQCMGPMTIIALPCLANAHANT